MLSVDQRSSKIDLYVKTCSVQAVVVRLSLESQTLDSLTQVSPIGQNFILGSSFVFFFENMKLKKVPIHFLKQQVLIAQLASKIAEMSEYSKVNEKQVLSLRFSPKKIAISKDGEHLFLCKAKNLVQYRCNDKSIETTFTGHKNQIKSFILGNNGNHLYR